MSHLLDSYRRNAEAARQTATTSTLYNVRAQAVASAERWENMIEQLEWMETQQELRKAAMVPRTYTTFD